MAVQVRVPTGNGATAGWTAVGQTNAWECVDEGRGTPNDATDYIQRSDSFARHEFSFTAFSITSSSVTDLTIYSRVRSPSGTVPNDFSVGIVVNSSLYWGAVYSIVPTDPYVDKSDTWTTNPDTAASWTEADIEGTGSNPLELFQVRATNMIAGDVMRCTVLEGEVTYVASGGSIAPTDARPLGVWRGMSRRMRNMAGAY